MPPSSAIDRDTKNECTRPRPNHVVGPIPVERKALSSDEKKNYKYKLESFLFFISSFLDRVGHSHPAPPLGVVQVQYHRLLTVLYYYEYSSANQYTTVVLRASGIQYFVVIEYFTTTHTPES